MNSKHWTLEQNDAGMWEIGYWENDCFNIDDSTPYWTKAEAQKVLDEMLEQDRRCAEAEAIYQAQMAYACGYRD